MTVVGNTGGMMDNCVASKLYRPGSGETMDNEFIIIMDYDNEFII